MKYQIADLNNGPFGEIFGSFEYPASTALEKLDPIAYRVGFTDWCNNCNGSPITRAATTQLGE